MTVKIVLSIVLVLAGTCSLAAALGTRIPTPEAAGLCASPEGDARIGVDLAKHILALCEKDKTLGVFPVRLGRGGIGKTREGDGKTPIGTYSLEEPRPSRRFGTFILIGFPTEVQKQQGYTGSAVGVHGPHRWAAWLGSLVNTFDSTDGCVGVARDSEIERIAEWVRARAVRTIELR